MGVWRCCSACSCGGGKVARRSWVNRAVALSRFPDLRTPSDGNVFRAGWNILKPPLVSLVFVSGYLDEELP